MPSALETLVKILKLEREQGCKNSAVIGGFDAYSHTWQVQAHEQARKPEHHLLVDELVSLLKRYEHTENKSDRQKQIGYMLDRIMGRVPPPPEFRPQSVEIAPRQPQENQEPPPQREKPQHAVRQKTAENPHLEKPRTEPPRRAESAKVDAKRPKKRTRSAESASEPPSPFGRSRFETSQSLEYDTPRRRDKAQGKTRPKRNERDRNQLDLPPMPRLARPPRRPRPQITPEEAAERLHKLYGDVSNVKGVGRHLSPILEKVGVKTVHDLLFYLPRRYDDYTRLTYISRLEPEQVVTIIGTVTFAELRVGKNNRKDLAMTVDDGSGSLNVIFFGQHFLVRKIRKGMQVVLSGVTSQWGNRIQMTNPEWEPLDAENLHTVGIVPVYPLTEGLKPRSFRRLMKQAIDTWSSQMPDMIPEAILERAELSDIGWALKNLHFPEGWDHLDHARSRIMFDELLALQLAVLANRREWQSVPGTALTVTDDFLENFIQSAFPYELTGAQNRAIADIRRDVTQDVPMNRLIQGDVGAGKTAVATVAMAMAVSNGKQAAIMAPTSILAEQHFRSIGRMLETMPDGKRPVIALLTSALTNTERESIYRGLADGSIDVVIGTHALIQQGVQFHDLAVAVIDEQHRFGVEQRKALRGKGTNPHLLVMTATPIPRTLALTIYADLDLTIIDEKPPGRQPIATHVVEPAGRERIFRFVRGQLEQGRQVFVVHPLVEASDRIDAASAVEAFEDLQPIFYPYRICLLHGRMKANEKDEVMAAFARHEYDVMATTSVAEVGVDIPNASVMIIEGANRFGLAQLHQFRGRVGRGEHQSHCFLIADNNTPEAQERLAAMEDTDDGFKLAEIDWKLRGPGDLVGTRQSGRSDLKLAEELTPEIVALAQREARTLYEEDPTLSQPQHALLAKQVALLRRDETDVS